MRLLPSLVVRPLSGITPCELVRIQMQADALTLAIGAVDENGMPSLVCLNAAQFGQAALQPPVFIPALPGGKVSVLCLGKDYAFIPTASKDTQAYQDTDGTLNGALLIGLNDAFLQVHGIIGGFHETRYFNIANGTLASSLPSPGAMFSAPNWSIHWTDAEVLRHLPNPLFSFP